MNDSPPSADVTPAVLADPPVEAIVRRLCRPDHDDIMIAAHRGVWAAAPENSLAALAEGVRLGLDIVEMDVRRTADGVLVLMHDATVDRMTDGSGRIGELGFDELRRLRLRMRGGGPEAPLTDEPIPSLEEAIRAADGRILLNLDAKDDINDDAFALLDRLGAVGRALFKRRVTAADAPLGSTFPYNRTLFMPVVVRKDGPVGPALRRHLQPRPPAVELVFKKLGFARKGAAIVLEAGCRTWVNTLTPRFSAGLVDAVALDDPDSVWGLLIDLGFSIIQTDEPVALRRYLEARGKGKG